MSPQAMPSQAAAAAGMPDQPEFVLDLTVQHAAKSSCRRLNTDQADACTQITERVRVCVWGERHGCAHPADTGYALWPGRMSTPAAGRPYMHRIIMQT